MRFSQGTSPEVALDQFLKSVAQLKLACKHVHVPLVVSALLWLKRHNGGCDTMANETTPVIPGLDHWSWKNYSRIAPFHRPADVFFMHNELFTELYLLCPH